MKEYLTIDPADLENQQLHGYLLASVAPRPIAFVSTISAEGKVNLSPFSYFNVFSSNPPVMIFSPARSGRDNSTKHTYDNVKEVAEAVVNIVNYPIVEKMSLASTAYEKGVNEFTKAGLTEMASDLVKPPRVEEAPVAFECVVDQVIELGKEGGAGNLVICTVKKIHIQKDYLRIDNTIDSTKLDLVGRMGESWYCRASGEALFEIPKPIAQRGIGVDQLSPSIRNSPILTANNLGRLGNLESQPTEEEMEKARALMPVKELMLEFENQRDLQKDELHYLGQQYIENGDTRMAHAILKIVDEI